MKDEKIRRALKAMDEDFCKVLCILRILRPLG
jgi:hypothetical protein